MAARSTFRLLLRPVPRITRPATTRHFATAGKRVRSAIRVATVLERFPTLTPTLSEVEQQIANLRDQQKIERSALSQHEEMEEEKARKAEEERLAREARGEK